MNRVPWGWILAGLILTAALPADAGTLKVKRNKVSDTPFWTPPPRSHPIAMDTGVRTDTAGFSDTIDRPLGASDTHGLDTVPADTSAVKDTAVPDTLIYTARAGGRFYHRKAFAHAPQPDNPGALVTDDTVNFKDTFSACPICFQNPITEEDFDLEEAIANQVSGIVEFHYRRLDDDSVTARLARIGQPMTKILDRHHLEFTFTPLRSSFEKNAISAGNGNIYFTKGLLDIMEDDSEVAAVLAHEITHAELRHVLQDFKLSQKLTMITAIAGAIINRAGNIGGIFQVLQDYAASLVMNGFSRQYEYEADAGGRWILESLGYDTNAMRRVLLKLEDLSRDRPERSSLFATHPEESDRIKAFDAVRVFNKTELGDTISFRLKFQRSRAVGWFKERQVPALYGTLMNETDSDLIVSKLEAEYKALDMPDVKVEVSPSALAIPRRSYGQIKILVIAKTELVRTPQSVTLSCEYVNPDEPSPKSKKEKPGKHKATFHVDLSK